MGTQHIIELNGRKYDALTGKELSATTVATPKAQPIQTPAHSIDGFTKVKSHAPRRVSAGSEAHHTVHKSTTLMRKSVNKPSSVRTHTTSPHHKAAPKPAVSASDITLSQYTPPAERVHRAEKTHQSGLIQRFGASMASLEGMQPKAAEPAPAPVEVSTQPVAPTPSAIDTALSHEQPKLKKTPVHHRVARKLRVKPRTLSVSAAVMAFVVFGGFLALHNAANLSMRLASMKADVSGSLPTYKPAGFSMNGPIKYQPGQIVIAYKSNSDQRYFEITQKSSGWDTDALRENYVSPKKVSYQTIQEKGKTIYLYDDASATWVDGGVWYTIEGTSQLNTDQVLNIASSL